MSEKLKIRICGGAGNPGEVLLEDLARLSEGIQDSVDRMVQYELGYSVRARKKKEAQDISKLVMVGIEEGSTILSCQPAEMMEGFTHPAVVACQNLIAGVNATRKGGAWPPSVPPIVRNRIAQQFQPLLKRGLTLGVELWGDNTCLERCSIDEGIEDRLRDEEHYSADEKVQVVGTIYELHSTNRECRVDADIKKVKIHLGDEFWRKADENRWSKVFVEGVPEDPKCRRVGDVSTFRPATDSEEPGIALPAELGRAERSPAYQQVAAKVREFALLRRNWDSYGAEPPNAATLTYCQTLMLDVCRLLLEENTTIEVPFVVPTRDGGVQLEWDIEERSLELEFVQEALFRYYREEGDSYDEGGANRWQAVRLIRWVHAGAQP